jgi:hypothetical protein
VVSSVTWHQVDRMVLYIYIYIYMYIHSYILIIMCKCIYVWRRNFAVGGMRSWKPLLFTEDITLSSVSGVVFRREFYTALYFKANCVLFIYFHVMPFISHLGSIQLLHGDKNYNMEYNWVSNWRVVCQPCLSSTLVGFVWDMISGMTMGLPFHCTDPAHALTSCMKECLRKAWKFYPHHTNSVKYE